MVEPADIDLRPAPERRYGRVLVAWVMGAALVPAILTFVLSEAADARCDSGMTDCSWGLEVLIIVPVLLVCVFVLAPIGVYLSLRRARDPLAGSTARWAFALALASIVPFFLLRGLALLIPPLAGRYVALRRWRTATARRSDLA